MSTPNINRKFPVLPKGVKEVIIGISPWLVIANFIILLILFFNPGIVVVGGLIFFSLIGAWLDGSLFTSWTAFTHNLANFLMISPIILAITILPLEIIALPGLFARKKVGWNFIFYACLMSLGILLIMLIAFVIIALIPVSADPEYYSYLRAALIPTYGYIIMLATFTVLMILFFLYQIREDYK